MRVPTLLLLALLLPGCPGGDGEAPKDDEADADTDADTDTDAGDADGDGYTVADGDCDDADPDVHPGAADTPYDGVDADCDGASDDDADRDGHDDLGHGGDDCDDADPATYPGAEEVYADGIDQDCDGYADAADTSCAASFALSFADGATTSFDGCVAWSMAVGYEFDPDAPPEIVTLALGFSAWGDEAFQCTVAIDAGPVCEPGYYTVEDGAGVGWATFDCTGVDDADEQEAVAFTGWVGFTEVDTGTAVGNLSGRPVRTALTGSVFGYAPSGAAVLGTFEVASEQIAIDEDTPGACLVIDGDADGDGWDTDAFGGGDCDDADPASFPGAPDACDGVDQDCDGVDGVPVDWYRDADGDGYGDGAAVASACAAPDTDLADNAEDCDDRSARVRPGATEVVADGVDQDCDGGDVCYVDADGDAYGDVATVPSADTDCADVGEAEIAEDCDDTDAAISPEAVERPADGVDSDCDGLERCAADTDGDSYGAATGAAWSTDLDCTDAGESVTTDDCDDADATVNPGATESVADGVDADCDGVERCWDDGDRDGYGTSASVVSADLDCVDATEASLTGDCDDADAAVSPGDAEIALDGIDNDCDGYEACPADADRDGYGDRTATVASADLDCLDAGESTRTDDCDDADAASTIVGDDADCDGSRTAADCDDTDATVNPSAAEVCGDGVDNDCDGAAGSCPVTSGSLSSYPTWTGETEYETAASAVAMVGDVDNDGYDDFLVGSPTNGDAAFYGGAAYLVRGGPSPTSASLGTVVQYSGPSTRNRAGIAVGAAGDVNGDGYADMVIGGDDYWYGSTSGGYAWVVLGSATPASASLSTALVYNGQSGGDVAGTSVAGAGDVNGDGYDDLLVGAPYNGRAGMTAGAAYLVLGRASPSSASLSTATAFLGERTFDQAGGDVGGAGDVDGDGYDDMLVGAPINSDAADTAGACYLILGDRTVASASLSTAIQYTGEDRGGYVGVAVDGAGDVNGDGYDDVLVGAMNLTTSSGFGGAYVVLGSAVPASASLGAHIRYDGTGNVGSSVAGAGDVNADGFADIVAGAPGAGMAVGTDTGGWYAASDGAAYIVLGSAAPASDDFSAHIELLGEDASYAGESVGGGGDVDADGYDDVVIGALLLTDTLSDQGGAHLVRRLGL